MDYFVTWEIEVKAENPVEAARFARAIQTQSNTRATIFQVSSEDAEDPICVDLTSIAEES